MEKIRHTQLFNFKMRDVGDRTQERRLVEVTMAMLNKVKLIEREVSNENPIRVEGELWIQLGGYLNVVPDCVVIGYGITSKRDNRPFLVSDQASVTGKAPRIHFARHYYDGGVKIDVDHSFCASHNDSDGIATDVESVTCPECLVELMRTNQEH